MPRTAVSMTRSGPSATAFEADRFQITHEAGNVMVHLVFQLVAGDSDLLGIDHHDVIAGIDVRGENWFVFALQTTGNLGARLGSCLRRRPTTIPDGLRRALRLPWCSLNPAPIRSLCLFHERARILPSKAPFTQTLDRSGASCNRKDNPETPAAQTKKRDGDVALIVISPKEDGGELIQANQYVRIFLYFFRIRQPRTGVR